jgi:ribosomal protein S18 acetylase RimI-like enzyme
MTAAALAHSEGLQPTNLARDLRQIADLIELCFGEQLDAGGQAAIREMRMVGRLGPLLWLLSGFEQIGLGLGYVWLAGGRVIGNVSTYHAGRLPDQGPGWLIANVAVHPAWRQRGIARALMDAALDLIARQGGQWALLQAEHNNAAALALYDSMGFERLETLTRWHLYGRPPHPIISEIWTPRPRRADEWQTERALAQRARPSGMWWTRPLATGDFRHGPLTRLATWLEGRARQRWVIPDPDQTGRLLGSLWLDSALRSEARLTLLLDPCLDEAARRGLLAYGLSRLDPACRSVSIEHPADQPVEALLRQAGFTPQRSLVQMKLTL